MEDFINDFKCKNKRNPDYEACFNYWIEQDFTKCWIEKGLSKEFFKYFYLGDGVNNPKTTKERYSFTTKSKILAKQLRQILVNLNCFCSIVKCAYNEFTYYHCKINEQSYDKFNKIFNRKETIPELKAKSLWFDENYAYVRIRRIKTINFVGKVFNLEVEKSNSYTAEGIIVHNCWKIGDSFVKQRTQPYRDIYDSEKNRQLHLMENEAENAPKNKLHADLRARRKMVKIFLQHYYLVSRTLKGIEVTKPYPHDRMGHKHFIPPPLCPFKVDEIL